MALSAEPNITGHTLEYIVHNSIIHRGVGRGASNGSDEPFMFPSITHFIEQMQLRISVLTSCC